MLKGDLVEGPASREGWRSSSKRETSAVEDLENVWVSQALDRTLTFGSEYMVHGQAWNRQRFNSLPGSFHHCGSSAQVSSREIDYVWAPLKYGE